MHSSLYLLIPYLSLVTFMHSLYILQLPTLGIIKWLMLPTVIKFDEKKLGMLLTCVVSASYTVLYDIAFN